MEIKTPGFVLKKQNFGEADRILRIFTRDYGLIAALAKGVKKTKSRKAGSLELFSEANFRLHRKTGELFLLTDAAAISAFESKDLAVMRAAYAASELILNLAPPEKELPKTYQLFQNFLQLLLGTPKVDLLKIALFAKVFSILGFLPDIDKFSERKKKLLHFLLEQDLAQILRLENDVKIFAEIESFLLATFETVTEKNSRVTAATENWR
ncbi:MAG: DNA repair protein RecO [Candidatus Peribacteraceae bacterium]|nr:DNA repair protein RecO [Candidatus Peribacteraceae bacterium]